MQEKGKLPTWRRHLLRLAASDQPSILKEVSQYVHDESADRGVTVFRTWIDLAHATQVLDQALGFEHGVTIVTGESL